MAMVTPTQAVPTITPPSSSHGEPGSWNYATHFDGQNAFYDPKAYMSHDVSKTYSSRQPSSRPAQRRADTMDSYRTAKSNQTTEAYLVPNNRVEALGRKPSSQSEADSLLELYNRNGRQGSNIRNEEWEYEQEPNLDDTEKEASHWIHRDKLVQIERNELEEAGFLPRGTGSGSRSSSRSRHTSRKRESSAKGNDRHYMEEKKSRNVSPIPAEDEQEEAFFETDQRTLEEIAVERERHAARNPLSRPGTSRIPIAKSSPAPIPSDYVEREAPLPRSRSNSGTLSGILGEGIALPRTRRRAGSVGSQVLLDDVDSGRSITGSEEDVVGQKRTARLPKTAKSAASSPKKPSTTRGKSPGAMPTGSRKASTPRNTSQPKSRTTSTSRPRTSGNDRPKTAVNRPEGEAPWIATMFKPDPRLPPEQQMLPTHAKRMAQEQWEKEGNTGTIYDREFRLLNAHEYPTSPSATDGAAQQGPESGSQQEQEQDKKQPPQGKPELEPQPIQWPLRNPQDGADGNNNTGGRPQPPRRSDTNLTEHGGYKTMPTVHPAIVPTSTTTITGHHTPKTQAIRVQDPGETEDEKPKKSACCCTVM